MKRAGFASVAIRRTASSLRTELSASTGADVAYRVRPIPDYRTLDGAVLRANSRELEAAWDDGRSMTVEEAAAYALERHSAAATPA